MGKYESIFFDQWKDAKNYLSQFPNNWIFRGQSNEIWELSTSIERVSFDHSSQKRELEFINQFKKGAIHYLTKEEEPTSLVEWISLMQHHGAPTRFLDFSFSPYIASYFAFEEFQDTNHVIWAIDASKFIHESANIIIQKVSDSIEKYSEVEESIPEMIERNDIKCVFPIEPHLRNQRFKVQQGIFMCQGSTSYTFENNLDFFEGSKSFVKKIIIEKGMRGKALYDLNQMNINRESLFLNLDGFSKKLTMHFETLYSYSVEFYKRANLGRSR